jgi:hypothetical protein
MAFNELSFVLSNNNNRLCFIANPNIFTIVFDTALNAVAFTDLYNTAGNNIITLTNNNSDASVFWTGVAAISNNEFPEQVIIEALGSPTLTFNIDTFIDGPNRKFFNNILFGPQGNCGSILITNMGVPPDNDPPPTVLNSLLTILGYTTFVNYIPGGNLEDVEGPALYVSATPASLVCLLKGTKILTPAGEILIENLKINDTVLTADNREVKITDIYSSLTSSENNLYVIRKDIISRDVPNEDLFVSGGHRVKIHDKFYHPFHNKTNLIEKCNENKLVQFYHIKLENYLTDFLVANGVTVESLGDRKNPQHTRWDCSGTECILTAIKQM